jgi:hypothetical protein
VGEGVPLTKDVAPIPRMHVIRDPVILSKAKDHPLNRTIARKPRRFTSRTEMAF